MSFTRCLSCEADEPWVMIQKSRIPPKLVNFRISQVSLGWADDADRVDEQGWATSLNFYCKTWNLWLQFQVHKWNIQNMKSLCLNHSTRWRYQWKLVLKCLWRFKLWLINSLKLLVKSITTEAKNKHQKFKWWVNAFDDVFLWSKTYNSIGCTVLK